MRKKIIILLAITVFMLSSAITLEITDCEKRVSAFCHAPDVSAEAAILIDGNSGEIIYEKNSHDKMYPASTTKIMTCLLTLEIMEALGLPLDSNVIIPREAVGTEGSSIYLKEGEKRTVEDLLYGTMLRSGNDAATALACCMGGNQDNFVRMMNSRAEEIGCENTHFINSCGLFNEDHYTCARDLGLIALEAMKREDFREIVASRYWEKADVKYTNKNKTVFQYEGGNGVKIGFTKASGRTLVASSARGKRLMIAVVLKDSQWFRDAYALMDYGFLRSEK